jgi:hypothetical protein
MTLAVALERWVYPRFVPKYVTMVDSTGVIGLFEEVIANATGAAADQFYVSFSQEIAPLPTTSGGTATGIPTIIKSRKYKVVGVRHDNDGEW